MTKKEKLKNLYEEIATLTLKECSEDCRCPLSCCDKMYCELARNFAKETYNIDLKSPDNPITPNPKNLIFMSIDKGCIVPPYLRPNCSLHTCSINSLGWNPKKPKEWTKKYFEIRNKITKLEYELQH